MFSSLCMVQLLKEYKILEVQHPPITGKFHKYKALRRKKLMAELLQQKADKKRKIQEDFENDKKEKQLQIDNKDLKKRREKKN